MTCGQWRIASTNHPVSFAAPPDRLPTPIQFWDYPGKPTPRKLGRCYPLWGFGDENDDIPCVQRTGEVRHGQAGPVTPPVDGDEDQNGDRSQFHLTTLVFKMNSGSCRAPHPRGPEEDDRLNTVDSPFRDRYQMLNADR